MKSKPKNQNEKNQKIQNLKLQNLTKIYPQGKFFSYPYYEPNIRIANLSPININSHQLTIGKGAFSEVYVSKHIKTKESYAIKKMEKDFLLKTINSLQVVYNEIEIQSRIIHPNIIRLYNTYENKKEIYLIMEYIKGGNLYSLIKRKNGLNEKDSFKYFYQILKAVYFLHKNNIIHRDIKPENILIDKNMNLKLCDFGFSRKYYNQLNLDNNLMTDYIATRWYRAPEILLSNGKYGFEIDFWAIGCLMCELIDGKPIFPGKDEIDQINCISKILGNFNESDINDFCKENHFNKKEFIVVNKVLSLNDIYKGKFCDDGIDFIKQLLKVNPKERLNEKNVFLHKYYSNYEEVNKNSLNVDLKKENNKKISEENHNIKTVKLLQKEFSFPINSSRKKIKKLFVQNKIIDKKDSLNLVLYHSLSQRNINNNLQKKKSESFNSSKIIKETSSNNLQDKKVINNIISYHSKNSVSNKNPTNKYKLKNGVDFLINQDLSQKTIFYNNNNNFISLALDNSSKKKNKFQKNKSARDLIPSYCYQIKKNLKNENEDFLTFLKEKIKNYPNIENKKDKPFIEKLVYENKNKKNNNNNNNKLPYIVYYNDDFLRNKIQTLKKTTKLKI